MKYKTLNDYISSINQMVKCPSRVIANLINEKPDDLNRLKDAPFEDLPESLKEKMTLLNNIVHHFSPNQDVRNQVLLEILELHVCEDYKNRMDSVASALCQLKYNQDKLIEIAELAYEEFKKRAARKLLKS